MGLVFACDKQFAHKNIPDEAKVHPARQPVPSSGSLETMLLAGKLCALQSLALQSGVGHGV